MKNVMLMWLISPFDSLTRVLCTHSPLPIKDLLSKKVLGFPICSKSPPLPTLRASHFILAIRLY